MNIEIKISGETTDQTLVAVLASIAAITGGKSEAAAPVIAATESFKASTKTAPKKSLAEKLSEALDAAPSTAETEFAETPPNPTMPAATSTSKYTLEAVRAEAISISKAGKREEVKALIATHGGEKVTDLGVEVYDAFMADLAKLK
jgi:hypothetical protein